MCLAIRQYSTYNTLTITILSQISRLGSRFIVTKPGALRDPSPTSYEYKSIIGQCMVRVGG